MAFLPNDLEITMQINRASLRRDISEDDSQDGETKRRKEVPILFYTLVVNKDSGNLGKGPFRLQYLTQPCDIRQITI